MKSDREMQELLQAACIKAGGQLAWARLNGFTPQFVNAVLKGSKKMSPKMGKIFEYKPIAIKGWVKKKK